MGDMMAYGLPVMLVVIAEIPKPVVTTVWLKIELENILLHDAAKKVIAIEGIKIGRKIFHEKTLVG